MQTLYLFKNHFTAIMIYKYQVGRHTGKNCHAQRYKYSSFHKFELISYI